MIILAGGMGTRLKEVLPDLPKSMAPIHGKPFIYYIIEYLRKQGVERFIFALGYKHEAISTYINQFYPKLNTQFVIEKEPLGTGGALKLACAEATEKTVLAINGDSFFEADVKKIFHFHKARNAECTLALKPMKDFNRYGVVEVDGRGQIMNFKEKQKYKEGLINAGFYAIDVQKFLAREIPKVFSFEKDYLEKYYTDGQFYGSIQDQYFIDIGIPEDYETFKLEIKKRLK